MKIALAIALGFLLVGSPIWADFTLYGTVYYGMTQNTAENAKVVIWNASFKDSVYTTSSGTYLCVLEEYATYELYAEKREEETETQWWSDTAKVTLNEQYTQVDLHMVELE